MDNMFNQYSLVQLGDYIWQNDFVRLTGKKARFKSMKKIKLGNAVFIKKDTLPKQFQCILNQCHDLTNLYPQGYFFNIIGVSKDHNDEFERQGHRIEIALNLAYNIKLIKLTDEILNFSQKYSNIFLVNSKRPAEDSPILFLGKIKLGFY